MADWLFGMIEIDVIGSEIAPVTVIVAVPVTTVLSGLVTMAVMVAVPWPTAVAMPLALIVAICGLLDFHATVPVRFWEVPADVVPIALN